MSFSEYSRVIPLALLLFASIMNLFYPKHKNVSKAFLVPMILVYYLTSVNDVDAILVAALAASWLGDVLLMPQGNAWFTAGGISFMLSHFLFIGVYVSRIDFSLVRLYCIIPAVVLYAGVSAVIIRILKPSMPKNMVIPVYIYLLANSAMNVFSLMQLICNANAASLIAYIGALLFFVSDCTLFIVRYYKNGKFHSYFLCMLTYILGEFLITQGIIMLTK